MKLPASYANVKCPECGRSSTISVVDSWGYWLATTHWRCPHCREYFSTAELHEHERVTDAK